MRKIFCIKHGPRKGYVCCLHVAEQGVLPAVLEHPYGERQLGVATCEECDKVHSELPEGAGAGHPGWEAWAGGMVTVCDSCMTHLLGLTPEGEA